MFFGLVEVGDRSFVVLRRTRRLLDLGRIEPATQKGLVPGARVPNFKTQASAAISSAPFCIALVGNSKHDAHRTHRTHPHSSSAINGRLPVPTEAAVIR